MFCCPTWHNSTSLCSKQTEFPKWHFSISILFLSGLNICKGASTSLSAYKLDLDNIHKHGRISITLILRQTWQWISLIFPQYEKCTKFLPTARLSMCLASLSVFKDSLILYVHFTFCFYMPSIYLIIDIFSASIFHYLGKFGFTSFTVIFFFVDQAHRHVRIFIQKNVNTKIKDEIDITVP